MIFENFNCNNYLDDLNFRTKYRNFVKKKNKQKIGNFDIFGAKIKNLIEK